MRSGFVSLRGLRDATLWLLSMRYALPVIVFFLFLIASWTFYGPAYLSDEVAYLDKAATIAGQTVHVSNSWFAGYSIMVSPAFFLSHDPYVEWRIILVLNALMWAGTAALLQYILRMLYPKTQNRKIALASAAAIAYPAWIAMSGYAFATSGFVLVLMASIACLLRSNLKDYKWLTGSALLGGYLFWIHPLGAVYTTALIILTGLAAYVQKQRSLALVPIAAAAMALAYTSVVSPLLNKLMQGDDSAHYAGTLHNILASLSTGDYWVRFLVVVLGLSFSLIIATFGIVVFGGHQSIAKWREHHHSWRKSILDLKVSLPLLFLLIVAGALIVNAASMASNPSLRLDEWVYGRYVDMFILPIIGYGLLAKWPHKVILKSAFFIFLTGMLLSLYATPQNTAYHLNNKVNIQGFWPMQLASPLHIRDYFVWGAIGTLSILVVCLAAAKNKRAWVLVMILPIVLLTDAANVIFHRTILVEHSTVSSIYDYVKTNYKQTDCIGFTPDKDGYEQFSLYSYYLHGYNVRKMTIKEWRDQKCKGPYFLYSVKDLKKSGLRVNGVDFRTGLVVTHNNPPKNGVIIFN